MRRRAFLRLSVLTPLAMAAGRARAEMLPQPVPERVAALTNASKPDGHVHRFALAKRQFLLDGQPFQIRSGQMDFIRSPRGYWHRYIHMARAMGMNTVTSYMMWNAMEREPGQFDLTSGTLDFVSFIKLCAEEGMWVYLRPGPFVSAEWDFGGLPAWLLRSPGIKMRNVESKPFMDAVARYFDSIAPKLAPLMVDQGGPVLMIQLDNEYASFGHDLSYLLALQKMWRQRGINGPFSISDGLPELEHTKTYVPGAALGLDGGTDFIAAQTIARESPVWVGEGYTGWLSKWGDKSFPTDTFAPELRQLMDAGRSFNLYEIHGGTNFGFTAGAGGRRDGSVFWPVITSYDYSAPISEQGVPTDDYHRFRAIISGVLKRPLPDIPPPPPAARFAEVMPRPWTSVWDHLPSPKRLKQPQSNETLFGQNQGMVLYRTRVHLEKETPLHVEGVHDYATIFADGKYVGTISRVRGQGLPEGNKVMLPASAGGATQLDILIDSFGHMGYANYRNDSKGLVSGAHLPSRILHDWQVFALPLDDSYVRRLKSSPQPARRPGVFFRATVARQDAVDTYVDMSEWDKGYVWVNGHLLGRYWRIGPQQRLYCPADWWKAGDNEVVIFDQHRTKPSPIWGEMTLHNF